MRGFLICPVALILAACAGTPDPAVTRPQDGADAVMAAQEAGQSIIDRDGEKLVCRREKQTGSHTRYTTACLTQGEWDELARSARQTTEDISRRRPPPKSN